jgi:hypothetical protein
MRFGVWVFALLAGFARRGLVFLAFALASAIC